MNKSLFSIFTLLAIYLIAIDVRADELCDFAKYSKNSYSYLFVCLDKVSKNKSSNNAVEFLELIISNKFKKENSDLGKVALSRLEKVLEKSEFLYYKWYFSGFSLDEEKSLRKSAELGNGKAAAFLLSFNEKLDEEEKRKYLKLASEKGGWLGAIEYADYLLSLNDIPLDEVKKQLQNSANMLSISAINRLVNNKDILKLSNEEIVFWSLMAHLQAVNIDIIKEDLSNDFDMNMFCQIAKSNSRVLIGLTHNIPEETSNVIGPLISNCVGMELK